MGSVLFLAKFFGQRVLFITDDHSRVILKPVPDFGGDYINANYLPVSFISGAVLHIEISISKGKDGLEVLQR